MGSSEEAILKTLLYSDIFDYPLSKDEVWKYLISKKIEDKQSFLKCINRKNFSFSHNKTFYFVRGREDLIKKREEKEKYGLEKIKYAKKIISKLSLIPTVYFIGISGALAMKNSDKNDDIDLFVITAKNSVWITRFVMVLMLKSLGLYRKRNDKNYANKICLNMLIDKTALRFSQKRNDLYTAHEIAQIMPVFNRDNTYKKFIYANDWVNSFLPNVFSPVSKITFASKKSLTNKLVEFLLTILPLESTAKVVQIRYMKKHMTRETVSDNFLAFHPFDYKTYVLKNYKKKVAKYVYSN